MKPSLAQEAINRVPKGTRFVDEAQFHTRALQFLDQLLQRADVASNAAVQPHFRLSALGGQGYFDGVFVCIQADKCDTFFHDLPPWLWLCIGLPIPI